MASPLAFAQDVIQCSLCENGVEYYCKPCLVKLCDNCVSVHLSVKNKTHKVVNFTSRVNATKTHECSSEEENNCEIFCRDCKTPICAACVVGVHREHDLIDLEVFLDEMRNKIEDDIKKMKFLVLPKFQKKSRYYEEEEYENMIEEIFDREDVICSAVQNFGSKLKEKVMQHKKDNEEKVIKNKDADEKFLKTIREAKSLLTSDDSKAILQFRGIKPEFMESSRDLNICVPILDTKCLQEQDIASLFGQLVFNPIDRKDKNKTFLPGGNVNEKSWFHGWIPREEAERLLLKDGDFLVRESEGSTDHDRCFVVSTYRQGPVHFFIRHKYVIEKHGPNATVVDYVNSLIKSGKQISPLNSSVLERQLDRQNSQLDHSKILLDSNFREEQLHNSEILLRGSYGSRTVFIQGSENQKRAFKNLMFLRQFEHPNIIRLIGYSALKRPILLVMEYLSGGSLLSYLRKKGFSISKRKRVKMCRDVASGMAYLHLNRCLHRDLAARNCSVGDRTVVKISNFWMAESGEEYKIPKNSGIQIPIKWTAPEVLNSGKYKFPNDVWSFGILMWEIFSSGKVPYSGLTNVEARKKITSGYRLPAPSGTPNACYDLMLKCWDVAPYSRYQFNEIVGKLQEILTKY